MTLTLTQRATAMLDDMPPYEADDPRVQQVIQALANELGRIEARAQDVVYRMFVQHADDTYNTLALWELLLGIPVKPAGVDLATRQSIVIANLRARNAGSGSDWISLLTTALQSSSWTHQEGPSDYTITLRIPYAAGGYTAGQVAQVARRITPAHLQINSGLTTGFLIGISGVGDIL